MDPWQLPAFGEEACYKEKKTVIAFQGLRASYGRLTERDPHPSSLELFSLIGRRNGRREGGRADLAKSPFSISLTVSRIDYTDFIDSVEHLHSTVSRPLEEEIPSLMNLIRLRDRLKKG